MSENNSDKKSNIISPKLNSLIFPSSTLNSSNISSEKIEQVISLLEKAIEKVDILTSLVEKNSLMKSEEKESASPLTNFWKSSFNLLQELKEKSCEAKNVHFEELTEIFIESICFQQDILLHSFSFQKPGGEDMKKLLSILQNQIKRTEKILILEPSLNLQYELVQKGMNTLMWMFDAFKCDLIVNNNMGIINEISNKIIKMGYPIYAEWVNTFMKIIREIYEFVNKNYKNGLIWSAQGNNNTFELILELGDTYKKYFKNYSGIVQNEVSFNQIKENDERNKMFEGLKNDIKEKELNQKKIKNNNKNEIKNNSINNNSVDNIIINEEISFDNTNNEIEHKKNLSTSMSQKGHISLSYKNSIKDTGSSLYLDNSSKSGYETGVRKKLLSMGQRDHYEEKDNIILFENFDGLIKNIKPDILDVDTFVRIINCLNCTFKISKSINRIIILNCQNCKVICDGLFSDIEIVNGTQIIMQCDGLVHMANVEGSKDVMIILSPQSRNIPIYCHHSTFIRVKTLKTDNNDNNTKKEYDEYIFPEQFEFCVGDNMKLEFNVTSI